MNETVPLSDDELDRLIRHAAAPMRVTDGDIAHFDALHVPPLPVSGGYTAQVLATLRPLTRIARQPSGSSPKLAIQLLNAQLRVLRREIWAASALVMAIGFAVALVPHAEAGTVLSLFAPLVAAAGVAFIYGPENDPPLEIALATPTSPRLVLLARLTVVCGYDFVLALLASIVLVMSRHVAGGVGELMSEWLGPMLLLSGISLWLSMWWGSIGGASVALTLWVFRVMLSTGAIPAANGFGSTGYTVLGLVGQTNVVTVGLAILAIALVCVRLPSQERLTWA